MAVTLRSSGSSGNGAGRVHRALCASQGWAKVEAPVRHQYDHGQLEHLWVELEEAGGNNKTVRFYVFWNNV